MARRSICSIPRDGATGSVAPREGDPVTDETEFEHDFKNYLAIILGYAELLLDEMSADDPRVEDLTEIHKAATAAVALLNSHRAQS